MIFRYALLFIGCVVLAVALTTIFGALTGITGFLPGLIIGFGTMSLGQVLCMDWVDNG
jgi:hypothetical protein